MSSFESAGGIVRDNLLWSWIWQVCDHLYWLIRRFHMYNLALQLIDIAFSRPKCINSGVCSIRTWNLLHSVQSLKLSIPNITPSANLTIVAQHFWAEVSILKANWTTWKPHCVFEVGPLLVGPRSWVRRIMAQMHYRNLVGIYKTLILFNIWRAMSLYDGPEFSEFSWALSLKNTWFKYSTMFVEYWQLALFIFTPAPSKTRYTTEIWNVSVVIGT